MKISFGAAVNRYVYDARLGERRVQAVYYGTRKVYPDAAARVRMIRLDMGGWAGTPEGNCWARALEAVSIAADGSRHIRLTAGRTYSVQSAYGSYPAAAWLGDGRFEFAHGEGPLAQGLRLGDTATLRLLVPALTTAAIGGTEGDNGEVAAVYAACLPETEVRGYFTKGQKKVSTGVRVRLESLPSGAVLMDRHQQQNGHCRGSYDWNYGWAGPVWGDTQVRLTVWPHQARGPWGGYLISPAISRTLSARIIQMQTEA
ncbi:hypothetical protein [Akkermansia glycaniphila]|uniref:Uncharacterized protein n=3 Tax=Akkermansia glycaniphila TaxID=1679444 RepID=A0A1H6M7D0_9BACT|nr:hypothetical protein [Akkermansia glycaniphila]SEH97266.1 Hypothetical protein PYTT_2200 [Akkermansia glycaniphila]